MEQAQTGKGHSDTIFVAGFNNIVIANRTACLSNILYAAAMSAFNIVAKGEEGITAKGNVLQLCQPSLLFSTSQRLWLFGEEVFPNAIGQNVLVVIRNIYVDGVVAVGTTNAVLKGQCQYLRVLAQPPNVSLVASQTSAMYAGLLAS